MGLSGARPVHLGPSLIFLVTGGHSMAELGGSSLPRNTVEL
jgi:hypothetical protein